MGKNQPWANKNTCRIHSGSCERSHCKQGIANTVLDSGVPGGIWTAPPPEIPKALQNRAKLNPIVKTVKNCWI